MNRRIKEIVLICVSVLTIATSLINCSSGECLDNKNSLPLAGFYSSEVSPQQISIDSISVYGLETPEKSRLLDSVRNVHNVYLPFRIDEPTTTYVFDYHQTHISDSRLNDTIAFNYDIIPFFVSKECGAIYKYKIKNIVCTKHLIDSVVCSSDVIDNVDMENLKIYFRVLAEE